MVNEEELSSVGTSDVTPTLQVSEELQPEPIHQPVLQSPNTNDPKVPLLHSKTPPSSPKAGTSHTIPPASDPPPAPDSSLDDLLFGNVPLEPDSKGTNGEAGKADSKGTNGETGRADSKHMPEVMEVASSWDGSGDKESLPVTTGGQADPGVTATGESNERSDAPCDLSEVGAGTNTAAGSTNKPRVLPAWLASITTAASHTGSKGRGGATKKGKAPSSKKKASESSDQDITKPAKVGTIGEEE